MKNDSRESFMSSFKDLSSLFFSLSGEVSFFFSFIYFKLRIAITKLDSTREFIRRAHM